MSRNEPSVTRPPTVHQIALSQPGQTGPAELIQRVGDTALSELDIRLWGWDSIESLLRKRFPKAVRRAFADLSPFSYKADLARYCIILAEGGWYSDLGNSALKLPCTEDLDMVVFRHLSAHTSTVYGVQSALFFAQEGCVALERAIETVVRNTAHRYYGANSLDPTGPNVLGFAVAQEGRGLRILTGDFLSLTPEHALKNKAFVLPGGEIAGFYKSGAGGVSGLVGGNNYNDFWLSRCVYGEASLPATMSPALDAEARLEEIVGRPTVALRAALKSTPRALRVRIGRTRGKSMPL